MTPLFHVTPDGTRYAVYTQGSDTPLVLLHGFTGSAQNWLPLLDFLPKVPFPPAGGKDRKGGRILALDFLGHGQSASPADPARYRMERTLEDLDLIFSAYPSINLLGYSMGGRVALSYALAHPERVRTLILESASPGLATETERAARIQSDEALAASIERDGIESFINYWEKIPLFASQANLSRDTQHALREQRIRNNPLGLANSLRGLGTGAQPSQWENLHQLTMPVLLLAGALDTKFTAIARAMSAKIPHSTLTLVENAGHTIHLEQPERFGQEVIHFLEN